MCQLILPMWPVHTKIGQHICVNWFYYCYQCRPRLGITYVSPESTNVASADQDWQAHMCQLILPMWPVQTKIGQYICVNWFYQCGQCVPWLASTCVSTDSTNVASADQDWPAAMCHLILPIWPLQTKIGKHLCVNWFYHCYQCRPRLDSTYVSTDSTNVASADQCGQYRPRLASTYVSTDYTYVASADICGQYRQRLASTNVSTDSPMWPMQTKIGQHVSVNWFYQCGQWRPMWPVQTKIG
jgi:hypothetical protein